MRAASLRYQLSRIGFRRLTGLISEAGLLSALSGDEEFTMFAPNNGALKNFLASNPAVAETLDVMLKQKD